MLRLLNNAFNDIFYTQITRRVGGWGDAGGGKYSLGSVKCQSLEEILLKFNHERD